MPNQSQLASTPEITVGDYLKVALVYDLASWSICVGGLGVQGQRVGGLKQWFHFSESRTEITPQDQVWTCQVKVLYSRSIPIGGLSYNQVPE